MYSRDPSVRFNQLRDEWNSVAETMDRMDSSSDEYVIFQRMLDTIADELARLENTAETIRFPFRG